MDLPPPLHGMSAINVAFLNQARQFGLAPVVINTSPSYFSKLFPSKLWKLVKVVHTSICILRLFGLLLFSKERIVYRPINGGTGKFFDILYFSVTKMFRCKVFIHHHSFNYLNNFDPHFKKLNHKVGDNTVHIVLGSRMKTLLQDLYAISPSQTLSISNLAFFGSESKSKVKVRRRGNIKIGHLANLCIEKGVDDFLKICEQLIIEKVDFTAYIAGPFSDTSSKKLVEDACNRCENIEYLGPLYGEQKTLFYEKLDCFIFPSRYENEAEPLVLYEAATQGVLLMGSERGCMKEVLNQMGGYSCLEGDSIVKSIATTIIEKVLNNEFSEKNRIYRQDKFKQRQDEARLVLLNFLNELRVK